MSETKWSHAGFSVRLEQDMEAESPRGNDNLGTLAIWHGNYLFGDKKHLSQHEIETAAEGSLIVLPVYLLDHSGLRLSCEPFSCPWDSGQVGYIYVDRKTGLTEFASEERVRECLKGEVRVMDRWLSGEFCGFVINDSEGEMIDSCWGFDDADYAREEANALAEWHAKDRQERLENAWGGGMSGHLAQK